MPQPMRELRVKNAYVNHKAIIASQGVKVTAKDLEKTLAGTPILVAKKPDEIEVLKVVYSTCMYDSFVWCVRLLSMRMCGGKTCKLCVCVCRMKRRRW